MNNFNDEVCDYISTPSIENFGWFAECPFGTFRKYECPSGCARRYFWNAPGEAECIDNYN